MQRFNITDRRLNPHGKSLHNRQRFVERVKASVKAAAGRQMKSRSIDDQSDAEITVSKDGIEEPNFHYARDLGNWDYILPGNEDFAVGDTIPRPPSGQRGRGNEGSPDGDGEDDFRFYISFEEFLDAVLDDLSLPDMIKASKKTAVSYSLRRAGYTTVGATTNLALERTMIHGLGRRIALRTPKLAEIAELEAELAEATDAERIAEIKKAIQLLRQRADAINFLEKSDLRYNNFMKQPHPITRAVVFAGMDVSGSMTEHMKDLAKRFYLLLYVFLTRQYKDVDIVFVRHTHEAKEVNQDEFFNSPETGGTVVSTAYKEIKRIIDERYDINEWNMYLAQVSDGDNTGSDNETASSLLSDMLHYFQYVTYVEVGTDGNMVYATRRDSDIWQMFQRLIEQHPHVAARRLTRQEEVVSVLRSLFSIKQKAA